MSLADLAGKAVEEAERFAKAFLKKAPKIPDTKPLPKMEPVPPKIGAPPGTGLANKPPDGPDPDDTRVLTFRKAADAVDEVLNAGLFDPNPDGPDPIKDLTKIIDFFSELVGGGPSDSDQADEIKAAMKKRLLPQTKKRSGKEKAGFRRIPLR